MFNVIDKTKEVELCVFRNDLFTLQLDYKFNRGDIETLYLLAIPLQKDLKTLRDLTSEHLPLLYSIRDNSLKAIQERFGLASTQIKCLLHYLPTYYHLHVHFVHVSQIMRVGGFCGKSVFLDDVIENIEIDGQYYQKKTMQIQIGERHGLFKVLEEKGLIAKVSPIEKVLEEGN